MPSGNPHSGVHGMIHKLWIGALILVLTSLMGFVNILCNVCAHR